MSPKKDQLHNLCESHEKLCGREFTCVLTFLQKLGELIRRSSCWNNHRIYVDNFIITQERWASTNAQIMRLKQISAEIWLNKTRTLYRLAAKRCPKSTGAAQLTGCILTESQRRKHTQTSQKFFLRGFPWRQSLSVMLTSTPFFHEPRITYQVRSEAHTTWPRIDTSALMARELGPRAIPAAGSHASTRVTKTKERSFWRETANCFHWWISRKRVSRKFEKTTKQEMMRMYYFFNFFNINIRYTGA